MVRGTPAAAEDTVVEQLPVAGDLLHQPALAYWCGAMLPQLNDIHTPQPQPPDQDLVAFAPCPLQPRLLPHRRRPLFGLPSPELHCPSA